MALSANDALNYSDPATTSLGGLGGNMNAARTRMKTELDSEQKDMQPSINKIRETTAQPMPTAPEPKQASPAPDSQQFQKDSQAWIGAMAAFSSLIGARGRNRGTGALKAFAAGVNGLQKGNQQAFDNAYKTWKANSDAMMDEHKQEMDKYKAILNNRSLSEDEAAQEMKLVGYEHQNKVMMASKDFEQAAAIYDSAAKAQISVTTAMEKMDAKATEMQKQQGQQMEKYKSDPAMASLADAYHKGVPITQLVKGLGKDAQAKAQAIQDLASEKYGEFDWAEAHNKYMAQGTELRTIAGMAGKIELGGQMLDNSIPPMISAAKKVGLTESTDLNTIYNTTKRHLSDRDFQNFSTQLRAATSDYSVFLGRGRLTVHSDQEALKILHDDMGITSLQGFADAIAVERGTTSKAIDQTLGRTPVEQKNPDSNSIDYHDKYGLER